MADRPPCGRHDAPSRLRWIGTLEEAIRAEIWTARRLVEHASCLGEARQATANAPTIDLIARASSNQVALRAAYRAVSDAARQGRAVTPAAKWLLDNFHVVAEHAAELSAMLPRHMYRRLPAVVSGPLSGHARVYEIANDYVAHTDSRFERESFEQFVNAYQTRSPLTIRELWVLPVMLRAALLEILRRVAARTVAALAAREHADRCVDRLASDRPFLATGTHWSQMLAPPTGLMREPGHDRIRTVHAARLAALRSRLSNRAL